MLLPLWQVRAKTRVSRAAAAATERLVNAWCSSKPPFGPPTALPLAQRSGLINGDTRVREGGFVSPWHRARVPQPSKQAQAS